jgi:transposase InsO family protein
LASQTVHQIYTQRKPQTNIKPILTSKPGAMVQIDLIDFSHNPSAGNYNYILNVIDVFSRKCWLMPLKFKTSAAVDSALEKIILDFNKEYTISVIQSDNGTEFNGNVFQKFGIKHLTSRSYTPQQQGLCERSNGTIKSILRKVLFSEKKKDWKRYLPEIQNIYNTTVNRSLNKTPDEVFFVSTDAEHAVLSEKMKAAHAKSYKNVDTVLEVGQKVRILIEKKSALEKGLQNWSSDILFILFSK